MSNDQAASDEAKSIDTGTVVYDEDGDPLGKISGFTDQGFQVSVTEREGASDPSEDREPGKEFGEGYLMWRCENCGEMGELDDGMPDRCPNCDAPKEELYRWTED